jgi:hypothetical protein
LFVGVLTVDDLGLNMSAGGQAGWTRSMAAAPAANCAIGIYTRSKLPWVTLPADVPAFEVYYDSKKLWPAESLARRKAIFG